MANHGMDGGGLSEREAYYRALLDEQEESGLSVAAFAEEADLSAATLYSWRRRLGRAATRSEGSGLLEVCVSDDGRSASPSGPMVLIVAAGARIELDADFDEQALERLLGVLDRC